MFLLFYTMLAAAASAYAAIRLLHPTRIPFWGKALAGVVCFALFELTPASIVLRIAGVENGWTDLLAWTGYVAAGFLSVLLTFLVIRDLAWSFPAAFVRLVKRLGKPGTGSPSEATDRKSVV